MSAGAALDYQIMRINNDLNSIRNQIGSHQRYTSARCHKIERRLKLQESRTKPQRPRLPRLPRSTS